MTDTIRAYHFTSDTLRDGQPVPPIGETLGYEGKIVICQSGLHASRDPLDALRYAPGPMLHLVEISGDVEEQNDKLVGRQRTIIASIDATDLLREFARWCALQVIDLWDAPDVVKQYIETGDESLRDDAAAAARDAGAAANTWTAATAARSSAWTASDNAWTAAAAARSTDSAARSTARAAATAARSTAWAARSTTWATDDAWAAAAAATATARDAQRVKLTEMADAAFAESLEQE